MPGGSSLLTAPETIRITSAEAAMSGTASAAGNTNLPRFANRRQADS